MRLLIRNERGADRHDPGSRFRATLETESRHLGGWSSGAAYQAESRKIRASQIQNDSWVASPPAIPFTVLSWNLHRALQKLKLESVAAKRWLMRWSGGLWLVSRRSGSSTAARLFVSGQQSLTGP